MLHVHNTIIKIAIHLKYLETQSFYYADKTLPKVYSSSAYRKCGKGGKLIFQNIGGDEAVYDVLTLY